MTPLHLAAEGAHIKVVKYLIGQQVTNISIQDHNGVICDHAFPVTNLEIYKGGRAENVWVATHTSGNVNAFTTHLIIVIAS